MLLYITGLYRKSTKLTTSSMSTLNETAFQNAGNLLVAILILCIVILVLLHYRLPEPAVVARSGYALADGEGHALRFTQDTATNRAGMSISGNELPVVTDAVSNFERMEDLNKDYEDYSQAWLVSEKDGVQLSTHNPARSGYKPYRSGLQNDSLMAALQGKNIQLN